MSLQPHTFDQIPEETQRVAQAAFPKGNAYLRLREKFGELFTDQSFTDLFSRRGQPAESPGRLALVSVMQFAEGLSDRQAADAVRGRIDWKYALGLTLTDPGFDASVLSEFRGRLLAGGAEAQLFETLLGRFREEGLLKARGQQRTDATHVLAAIQSLNRLECVGETMRHALNILAVVAPEWLRPQAPAEWFARYARRFEEYRLPTERADRYTLAETIGTDGFQLLTWVYASTAPQWIREIPAVQVLRQVWVQQFYAPDGLARWRVAEDLPPSTHLIQTPYDPEARYGKKRRTEWTGYRVHLTETCEEETPHLITDVQTTPAPVSEYEMIPTIHADLAQRGLLPDEHLVDAGYVTAAHLVSSSKDHGVTLLGPVSLDPSWQAKAQQGFEAAAFAIDWEAQTVTCPEGRRSALWQTIQDRQGQPRVHVRFARADCQACPVHEKCSQSKTTPRTLTFHFREERDALQAARQRQTTEEFKEKYATRAGIEGTLSQGVNAVGLRRSRYIGLAKTHLQHLLTATAINLLRVAEWLAGGLPAQTRQSSFAALATATA